MDAGKTAEWLNALRRPSSVELPAEDSFTPADAAKPLGISVAGVRIAVKRHRLTATGNGKARRLPRETVLFLADHMKRGTGPATINHYVRAVRVLSLADALEADRIEARSKLWDTPTPEPTSDAARRELTTEELHQLFRGRPNKRTHIPGTDRAG